MPRPGAPFTLYPARSGNLPPLPAATVDYLHAERNVTLDGSNNVESWASVAGLFTPAQATPANRPGFAADGSLFNSKPVVQTFFAAQRALLSPVGATIFAIGSRPYVCCIARLRSLGGGFRAIYNFANAAGNSNSPALYTNNAILEHYADAVFASANVAQTANPVFFEAFLDASGFNTLAVNGTVVATGGTAGSMTNTAVRVSIGSNTPNSVWGDISMAFLLAASAVPSAAERTALRQWSLTYWGV